MSNLTSKYTFDLVVKDDKTKDSIRQLGDELKKVGKSIDLDDATKQAQKAMQMFDEMAADTSMDFKHLSKGFARESGRAIAELEKKYAELRAEQEKNTADREELTTQREKLEQDLERAGSLEEELKLKQDIAEIDEKLAGLNNDLLRDQIKRNQQLRYQLKAAQHLSQSEALRQKIEALNNKKGLKWFSQERKERNDQLKALREKLKLVEQEEKKQQKVTQAVGETNKQLSRSQKLLAVGTHLKGGFEKFKSVTGKVASIGKSAAGMIGGGIQAATQAAESQLDRERQAVRVKGFSGKDASDMLGQLNIKSGMDYSTIVDAINRVQNTMKDQNLSKDDLIAATEIELKYPGTSQAFASSGTEANMKNFNIYANRMRAIQRATGASDEQIAASTQMFANRKDGDFGNAKITEMQSIYLGLQNSGAFDTQEELDAAFDRFVKKQKHSKEDVLVAAANFDWSAGIKDERNRTQADNLLKDKDWSQVIMAATLKDDSAMQKTDNEKLVEDMRRIEEQKNKLIMTLVPAVIPLVEELAKILDGDGAKQLAQGMGEIFKVVVPILLKVLNFLNDFVLQNLKKAMEWLASKLGKAPSDVIDASTSENANGGIVWGKSIVGERGPEAIIPLDYSRAQRAENIAYSIQNNFSMSGNETTALSLAQAVSSRDFSRAMGKAAFKAGRLGAF